jgi:SIR2-like domain
LLIDSKENRSAFDKLVREVRTGQALAFTGAGTSAAVGYPTWAQLIEKLARRTRDKVGDNVKCGDTEVPIEVAARLDFLVSTQIFAGVLGQEYHSILRREFGPKDVLHPDIQTLVDLPFRHFLTSNYDPTLEAALSVPGAPCPFLCLHDNQAASAFLCNLADKQQQRHVVHVHGRYDGPERIVLTEEEYGSHYTNSAVVKGFWTIVTVRESCVFFGFSFRDLDLLSGFRTAKREFALHSRHFGVLPLADGVPEAGERVRLDVTYGIQPVFFSPVDEKYSGYGQLLQMIKELTPISPGPSFVSSDRVAPQPSAGSSLAAETRPEKESADVHSLLKLTKDNLRKHRTGGQL